jgi:hypothetical protein
MQSNGATIDARIRNAGYTALVCTVTGYLLIEAFISRQEARPSAYMISTGIGMAAFALVWRVAEFHRFAHATGDSRNPSRELRRLGATGFLLSSFVLAGIGYLGVDVLGGGWASSISLFAVCIYLFPWSWVPLYRTGILIPSSLIIAGAVARLCRGLQLPHPIILAFASWVFWAIATASLLRLVTLKKRKTKASPSTHPMVNQGGAPGG